MGDIKKQKKKYSKPGHPWNRQRISEEKELVEKYGLKRKKEIWKMNSTLSSFAKQAKELVTKKDDIKKAQLLKKLIKIGLLRDGASIEDVLSIQLSDIMERRLQTIVFRKKLARSMNQARQFIIHEHISVNGKKITIPSYMVNITEEGTVGFSSDSPVSKPDHPERIVEVPKAEPKKAEQQGNSEDAEPKKEEEGTPKAEQETGSKDKPRNKPKKQQNKAKEEK